MLPTRLPSTWSVNASTGPDPGSRRPSAMRATCLRMAATAAQPDRLSGSLVSEQEQFAQLLLKDESLLLVIMGLFFLAGIGLTFTPLRIPDDSDPVQYYRGPGHETITTQKGFFAVTDLCSGNGRLPMPPRARSSVTTAPSSISRSGFRIPISPERFSPPYSSCCRYPCSAFYELQMPNAIQSRLTAISNSQQGGTLDRRRSDGLFLGHHCRPLYHRTTSRRADIHLANPGLAMLGGLALYALGLGMGVPLLLIGTSAGKLCCRGPAAGWTPSRPCSAWSCLGVAIWLLERILAGRHHHGVRSRHC